MKCAGIILPACLLLPIFFWAQTGADCANTIPLTMDGICRSYSTSSTIDTAVFCGSGSSPVTYFSFTTNSTPDKVLIDITAPTAEPCEVMLYPSGCGFKYTSGGMCFNDGKGLWSFKYNFAIQPNTTYVLRVKTTSAGNITMCAKYNTPPNDDCAGALSIGTTPISDNNACETPGPGVTASQLCAATLENTAWYQFYVASNGNCVINIGSINCDNGVSNNSNGFQVGFFEGSCSSLSSIGCDSNSNIASNSFLQFTTPVLTAGTKVFIAIDGNAGSRCSYNISGLNILGVLSASMENFFGWKTDHSNILKWTMLNETDGSYDIERSRNGKDFVSIGRQNSKRSGNVKTDYSFEDHAPFAKSFYRIRQTDISGKGSVSNIIQLNRNDIVKLQLMLNNPVRDLLVINVDTKTSGKFNYNIINALGQTVTNGSLFCNQGSNQFLKQISAIPQGQYWFVLSNDDEKISKAFIKMNQAVQ
jgi:hypothetical protein